METKVGYFNLNIMESGLLHMKVHVPPRKCGAFFRYPTNFPKRIAFQHNNGVLGGGVAQAKFNEMIPELTDSCGVESFQCYCPCGLLATFILSPVQSCIDLIVGYWPASVGDRA
jgi:hypothetical protein